jgi:hypothetical protein
MTVEEDETTVGTQMHTDGKPRMTLMAANGEKKAMNPRMNRWNVSSIPIRVNSRSFAADYMPYRFCETNPNVWDTQIINTL